MLGTRGSEQFPSVALLLFCLSVQASESGPLRGTLFNTEDDWQHDLGRGSHPGIAWSQTGRLKPEALLGPQQ